MGSPRLIQITHARRGIPWLAIGVVAAPAAALIASAFIFYRSDVAWSLLRQGMLVWAVTAAFLFDEPPAPVVKATPRSPTWWHGARFLGAVPLLAVPILAASVWAIDRPDAAQPFGLSVQTIAAWLMVLAGASVASRFGRNAPGDVVAGGAVLTVLFLLVHPISIGSVPLLPNPADPKWDQSIVLWSVLGTAAVITIAITGWWRPRPKPTQSPPMDSETLRPRPIANETSSHQAGGDPVVRCALSFWARCMDGSERGAGRRTSYLSGGGPPN